MDILLRKIYTPADLKYASQDTYDELKEAARLESLALLSDAREFLRAAERAIARGRDDDARDLLMHAMRAIEDAENSINDVLARGWPVGWFLDIIDYGHNVLRDVVRFRRREHIPGKRVKIR